MSRFFDSQVRAALVVRCTSWLRRRHAPIGAAGALVLAMSTGAIAQPTITTQAYFEGSWHRHTVNGGATLNARYDETVDDTVSPFPTDSDYRYHGEVSASGGFDAGTPVLGVLAEMRGHHLIFDKAPDIPFGSSPLAQASATLRDTVTPTDPSKLAGAPIVTTLKFTISGATDHGPLCSGAPSPGCAGDYPFVFSIVGATMMVTQPTFNFRGFDAGTTTFSTALNGFNGVPETLEFTFFAVARADRFAAQQRGFSTDPGYYNSEGRSDFAHTVLLTGIGGTDGQGQALMDFRLLSSNGTAYAAAVPEPEPWTLTLGGLAVVFGTIRRRTGQPPRSAPARHWHGIASILTALCALLAAGAVHADINTAAGLVQAIATDPPVAAKSQPPDTQSDVFGSLVVGPLSVASKGPVSIYPPSSSGSEASLSFLRSATGDASYHSFAGSWAVPFVPHSDARSASTEFQLRVRAKINSHFRAVRERVCSSTLAEAYGGAC